jgi:methyl-accepting chemotaxis protein
MLASLRSQLVAALCGVGFLGVLLTSAIGYFNSASSLSRLTDQNLAAVRDEKAREIESIFTAMRGHITWLASSKLVGEAMQDFSSGFQRFEQEAGLSAADVDQRLKRYYESQFLRRLNANQTRKEGYRQYWPSESNSRLLQDIYISSNPNPLGSKDRLRYAGNGTAYDNTHRDYHGTFQQYLAQHGYYDLFLIDMAGYVVYSVFKEVDFATSLARGPYRNSNLAEAFRLAKGSAGGQARTVDYAPYAPSYLAQAGFMAAPVVVNGQTIGVVALQISEDRLNSVTSGNGSWQGLGRTGDIFVLNQEGFMRTVPRSYDDKEGYIAFARNFGYTDEQILRLQNLSPVGISQVQSVAANAAINGETSIIHFENDLGMHAIGAVRPLRIDDLNWALVLEMSEDEVGAITDNLLLQLVLVALVLLISIVVYALWYARSLTAPIITLQAGAERLALGSTDVDIHIERNDELGQLSDSFRHMIKELRHKVQSIERVSQGNLAEVIQVSSDQDVLGLAQQRMVASLNNQLRQVSETSQTLSQKAQEFSNSSTQISQGASQQAAALEEISASMEDIGKQIRQNAEGAEQANQLVDSNRVKADESNQQMQDMLSAMDEIQTASKNISAIIKTIEEIAFQTNVLAINAAVEAARAGAHGKGFAVVAEEVRSLAQNSANAARQTTDLIKDTAQKIEVGSQLANETAASLQEIVAGTAKVNVLINEISEASNNQSRGVQEITAGLNQLNDVTQANSGTANLTANLGAELSEQAERLRRVVETFTLENQSLGAGNMLLPPEAPVSSALPASPVPAAPPRFSAPPKVDFPATTPHKSPFVAASQQKVTPPAPRIDLPPPEETPPQPAPTPRPTAPKPAAPSAASSPGQELINFDIEDTGNF